ncbi:putative KH and PIN-domain containing protein [uncultured archaeon]|nr:putative KH and PIN-domain containing protein [uncultured archaeon]
MEKIFVPDTSVIIDGRVTQLIKAGELAGAKIILPNAVIAELEHQANVGRETGGAGLSEITELVELSKQGKIALEYAGPRPEPGQARMAKRTGDIDAIIRAVAKEHSAVLITSDKVQSQVAQAEGIEAMYFEPKTWEFSLKFKSYFTPQTLSVHLKEGCVPLAKIGAPGRIELREIGKEKLTPEDVQEMAKEIIEVAKRGSATEAFIEIERKGATVVQLREFRCAIARPPFSDGLEITIVHPILKVSLEDYPLSKKLKDRLSGRAEGVIVCGPPGAGKSTFTAALAEFYLAKKKIVKTMESPRDLQVVDEITQYAPLDGSFENTSDILLLVRPDYTIYDEMRKTSDFRIYSDMRLAGIGMVGVVHANRPIDAIHRFVGRVDLGVIPQIVDTIVFIKDGAVQKVYQLEFRVKVPFGMREQDLARPVIEVKDFETGGVEYEIYKFGEETVILPVSAGRRLENRIDEARLHDIVGRAVRTDFDLEVLDGNKAILFLSARDIPKVIGKRGKTIQALEHRTGYTFDVREKE